jgi:hypothetical protein
LGKDNLYCPHHNEKLVLREAKHGINAGRKFWGCPTWSKTACNYTVPYKTPKPTLKEKFHKQIKNKKGKVSPIKIVGFILLIPVFILGFFYRVSIELFIERRKSGL